MHEKAASRGYVAASLLLIFPAIAIVGKRGLEIYPENAAAGRHTGDTGSKTARRAGESTDSTFDL